jgi:hypothetical protein
MGITRREKKKRLERGEWKLCIRRMVDKEDKSKRQERGRKY